MWDDLHAFSLLLAVTIAIGVSLWNRAAINRERIRRAVFGLVPFMVLGVLSALLLNRNGGPEELLSKVVDALS